MLCRLIFLTFLVEGHTKQFRYEEVTPPDEIEPFSFPSDDLDFYDNENGNYEDYDPETDDPPPRHSRDLLGIKVLINGTTVEIQKLGRESILTSLWALNQINLSLNKKIVIWQMLTHQKMEQNPVDFLQSLGKIFLTIPEYDLFRLNYSNWEIINFIGTLEGLTRHRMGVVAYAIKDRWGADTIRQSKFINRIKGIICGFSVADLLKITSSTFIEIQQAVFDNIFCCTRRQLKVLLYLALKATTYGSPQIWTANTTATLGLMLHAMELHQIRQIRPAAVEGISFKTLELMSMEQLVTFEPLQQNYFSDLAQATYRRLTGIDINTGNAPSFCLLLYLTIGLSFVQF